MPRDELARVDLLAKRLRNEAVEIGGIERRWLRLRGLPRRIRPPAAEVPDDLAAERERVLVRHGVVVGDAGLPRVDVRAAQLLGGDLLARRRLHERRAADEDRAGALDDDRLVAHRRDVRAAGGARAHDSGDLRDAGS